ncbi:phage tail tape measure protein [Mannheimia sp. E30BD]|uniref:phage tail tape measure protein n=1 Tax=Mannheimia sp. E30BD TaxID=3278708 RepID=UPI00359E9B0C
MAQNVLNYIITLTDQISSPLKGVMKDFDRLGERGRASMEQIGFGVAGLIGAGIAVKSALEPAIEFNNAMANVAAAGVSDLGLKKVKSFALEFSAAYGIAAADVVDSTNEIARAIDGLTEDELIGFSKGSNLLAKATGSDVAEMGSYLSTMYGIFQQEADKMGKADWIEMMAGQATLTANMFKSSGKSLSDAFTNLMATGQSKGVALAEQFAVLGNLQSVMPGGQSGTKYAAFLKGIGSAQFGKNALGLNFLDAHKRMRPITEILDQIKQKYGDVIDEAESNQLRKAFGTDEAVSVISYLLPKIDQLKDNIAEIGDIKNLDDVAKIAKMVTDPWQRLAKVIENVKIAIGTAVLERLNPIIHQIADFGATVSEWLTVNKYVARLIGYIAIGVTGFGALAASITLLSGLFGLLKVGVLALLLPFKAIGAALFAAFAYPLAIIAKAATALSFIFTRPFVLMKMFSVAIGGVFGKLLALFSSLTAPLGALFGAFGKIAAMLRLAFAAGPLVTLKVMAAGLFKVLLAGFSAIFSPMAIFIALLAGVGIFIYRYRANFADLFAGIKRGFGSVGEYLSPLYRAFDLVKNAISKIINTFAGITGVSTEAANATEAFAQVGEIIGVLLGGALELVIFCIEAIAIGFNFVAEVFSGVAEVILKHWDNLVTAWKNGDWWMLLCTAFNVVSDAWDVVVNAIKNVWNSTVNAILGIWNKISSTLGLGLEIPITVNDSQLSKINVAKNTVSAVMATTQAVQSIQTSSAGNSVAQIPANAQPNGGIVNKGVASSYVTNSSKSNTTYHNSFVIQQAADPDKVAEAIMQKQQDTNNLRS